MYSNILVPIDTSYNTRTWLEPTLTAARDIAQKFGGRLHFITVIPDNFLKGFYPDVYTETVGIKTLRKLEAIVKDILPEVTTAKIHVEEGGICSIINRLAREIPADLIVMASHGPALKDYLLGSNATHVVLHTPCSVFIVRDKHDEKETSAQKGWSI
jgi:nucleotide-binding universal stress UspA family protein